MRARIRLLVLAIAVLAGLDQAVALAQRDVPAWDPAAEAAHLVIAIGSRIERSVRCMHRRQECAADRAR